MATVQVKNSSTGDMGTSAAKRARYEKSEVAYGKIPAAAFAIGDTVSFDDIPMKELIHATFKAGTTSLEMFNGANLSSAVVWDLAQTNGVTADINYKVTYIRGTGKVKDSSTTAGEGKLIKLTLLPPAAVAVTSAASSVGATTATLNGTVDPNGAASTVVQFEYGTATGVYTTTVAATASPLSWATTAQAVSKGLTGLVTATDYFYRTKATTVTGTVYGTEQTFTTL